MEFHACLCISHLLLTLRSTLWFCVCFRANIEEVQNNVSELEVRLEKVSLVTRTNTYITLVWASGKNNLQGAIVITYLLG